LRESKASKTKERASGGINVLKPDGSALDATRRLRRVEKPETNFGSSATGPPEGPVTAKPCVLATTTGAAMEGSPHDLSKIVRQQRSVVGKALRRAVEGGFDKGIPGTCRQKPDRGMSRPAEATMMRT
jgi:hypothetical protein